jgi:hypothetical protein
VEEVVKNQWMAVLAFFAREAVRFPPSLLGMSPAEVATCQFVNACFMLLRELGYAFVRREKLL